MQAEAKATSVKAEARRHELKAEAEGKAALAEAENAVSEQVLHTRLEQHRIDRMPAIIEQMVKPAEKIESIRINQVSGLGSGSAGGAGGDGGGTTSPFNQAVEGVLNMAVQLPAMQKLGRQLGVNLDVGGDGDAAQGGPADGKSDGDDT
ncbi:MAG: hypothetical protein F4092_16740 [Rhodospirillaceae bacterium]|nr:hypothetical protein [Rhodospirillaceae bacterium]